MLARTRNTLSLLLALLPALAHADSPAERLEALGIQLPESSPSIANYVGAVQSGNLVFVSGHLPRDAGGAVITGKLGADAGVEAGYEAARQACIALLGTLHAELGSLDRVVRVVKVFGMVNATHGFSEHSAVVNGCSDLLVEVFGDRGRHARAAAGFSSLPLGAVVEVELIVEIAPE